jgi:hypothetical protein
MATTCAFVNSPQVVYTSPAKAGSVLTRITPGAYKFVPSPVDKQQRQQQK